MQSEAEIASRESGLNSLSMVTTAVVLLIVTMTFGVTIVVFFVRSQSDYLWERIHIPGILWATTAVLLASSAVFEVARRRLKRNDQTGFFRLMMVTTGLGLLFLAGQLAAWFQILRSSGMAAQNPHSWFIFLFSGLHGVHILVGLAGLGYLLARTREPAGGPKYQMTTRAIANGVSLFWHYLDFLWLVLFLLLVAWRR